MKPTITSETIYFTTTYINDEVRRERYFPTFDELQVLIGKQEEPTL